MRLVERFVGVITYVVSFLTFSGVEDLGGQAPLFESSIQVHNGPLTGGPVFKPPTGRPSRFTGGDLNCDYSRMGPDWESCSNSTNRGCWLRNTKTGEQYNITTDYEDPSKLPKGIDRHYTMRLADGSINADGQIFEDGKFFWNESDPDSYKPENRYPGPWVQACWGDTVHIKIINDLEFNGTAVHWHGIRQFKTPEADGVPGITQCPVAPGDSLTYTWTARQYGSSWYHSHFSLQYADGALGPITIHGPSSDDWDEPKYPILMTDWGHNSAFDAIWNGLKNQSTLLNGVGDIKRYDNSQVYNSPVPEPYNLTFSSTKVAGRAKRYLLRLINTSFESNFIFSIDNHNLTVVSADFVAIHPYNTTSVTIGIGQRYNVIVTADPINSSDKSFWMRAYRPKCYVANDPNGKPSKGYELAGIIFYDEETKKPDPKKNGWPVDPTICADEPYTSLRPMLEWKVGKTPSKTESDWAVHIQKDPRFFPTALMSIGGPNFNPLAVDYSNPTFLHLENPAGWNPRWVVYDEDYKDEDWVYLVLKGVGGKTEVHPIHLHGHDFAILEQATSKVYNQSDTRNFTWNNPPRRDVVLLPTDGYVVMAIRTDNPGPWIMHCHIAQHASFGLALQLMERQGDAYKNAKHGALLQAQRTCNAWNKWWGDCDNWWFDNKTLNADGTKKYSRGQFCDKGVDQFSPDSGI